MVSKSSCPLSQPGRNCSLKHNRGPKQRSNRLLPRISTHWSSSLKSYSPLAVSIFDQLTGIETWANSSKVVLRYFAFSSCLGSIVHPILERVKFRFFCLAPKTSSACLAASCSENFIALARHLSANTDALAGSLIVSRV